MSSVPPLICPNCHADITPLPGIPGRKPQATCKRGHAYAEHGYRDARGYQCCRKCHNLRHWHYSRGLPVPQEGPLL